jgi:hypothetical protein
MCNIQCLPRHVRAEIEVAHIGVFHNSMDPEVNISRLEASRFPDLVPQFRGELWEWCEIKTLIFFTTFLFEIG